MSRGNFWGAKSKRFSRRNETENLEILGPRRRKTKSRQGGNLSSAPRREEEEEEDVLCPELTLKVS
jgi:hypothetical protein